TNMINWLMKGGVSDEQWTTFKAELESKVRIGELQAVYQAAYDRYQAE
ncbi:MAG: hypothetical protein HUJ75_04120, partial [Parasporobacterium sp.]|nr:hypothetical protein [Parasporobacterium sp.]